VAPHVEYWWETFCEKKEIKGSTLFVVAPTWGSFRDLFKEQYYPVGNYADQYMRWTTLQKERGQTFPEFKNTFHTLRTKLGIKESEWHLVLKYHGDFHGYIQTKMEFLDISSMGAAYRYVVKI
jgi:hypothetical protein